MCRGDETSEDVSDAIVSKKAVSYFLACVQTHKRLKRFVTAILNLVPLCDVVLYKYFVHVLTVWHTCKRAADGWCEVLLCVSSASSCPPIDLCAGLHLPTCTCT